MSHLNNKKDYRYYVVNIKINAITSGWEYQDDAKDELKYINEVWDTMDTYKIYTLKYVTNMLKIDVNNNNNWRNN